MFSNSSRRIYARKRLLPTYAMIAWVAVLAGALTVVLVWSTYPQGSARLTPRIGDSVEGLPVNQLSPWLEEFRKWATLFLALLGGILGVFSLIKSRSDGLVKNKLQAKRRLDSAWDLLGGKPGTLSISEFDVDSGTLELANRLIEEAHVLDPRSPLGYLRKGAYLESQGKWLEAVQAYEDASLLDSSCAKAHYNRGAAMQRHGRLIEAAESYRKALDLDREDADCRSNLGVVLLRQGYPEQAEVEFRLALKVWSKNPEFHCNLGISLHRQRRLSEAIDSYREAIGIKESYVKAYCNLGTALFDQAMRAGCCREQLREAALVVDKAISIDPSDVLAHFNLGVINFNLEHFELATQCYLRVVRIKPDFAEAFSYLGTAYYRLLRMEDARAAFEQALRIRPHYKSAKDNLRKLDRISGLLGQDGVATCSEADSDAEGDLRARLDKAVALRNHERFNESAELCAAIVRKHPSCAEAYTCWGLALDKLGQKEFAVSMHRKAVDLEPRSAVVHSSFAALLSRYGKGLEAIAFYKTAIRLDPSHSVAHYGLQFLLQRQIELEDTATDLLRFRHLGSDDPGLK